MQVAWPLRHPGVDRPASVSVSPFLLLHVFPLTLSLPLFLSPCLCFFFLHCQCPYHNISSSVTLPPPFLPSTTFFHRASAVPFQCRCGSTSCVGSGATCGQSFRRGWPRGCSARCCQRLCSCWCKDMPGPVLRTRDTCKSGTYPSPFWPQWFIWDTLSVIRTRLLKW